VFLLKFLRFDKCSNYNFGSDTFKYRNNILNTGVFFDLTMSEQFEDTKGVIGRKQDRRYSGQKIPKGVIIILVFYGSLFVLLAIVLSVLLPSDYPFGIFWPLYCLSCFRPITHLVSFGHCKKYDIYSCNKIYIVVIRYV
jgi:hypothetical protein